MSLHPYMGFVGDAPEEGAVLVFAHDAREARPLAYLGLNGLSETAYVDVRVRRMRKHLDYLRTLGDDEKLAEDRSHVIDDPRSCPSCGCWGVPIEDGDNACQRCRAEAAE